MGAIISTQQNKAVLQLCVMWLEDHILVEAFGMGFFFTLNFAHQAFYHPSADLGKSDQERAVAP